MCVTNDSDGGVCVTSDVNMRMRNETHDDGMCVTNDSDGDVCVTNKTNHKNMCLTNDDDICEMIVIHLVKHTAKAHTHI